MTATILDGKATAAAIRLELKERVSHLRTEGIIPRLAVVLVGDDPASKVYVGAKTKAAAQVGVETEDHVLSEETSQAQLLSLVQKLNGDDSVHGILVQLPLPEGLDEQMVLDAIRPEKDVDGFHPHNQGLLMQGRPWVVAATPRGCMSLLRKYEVPIGGKTAVVVGRSNIVGKPMAALLTAAHATVTVAHSRTQNLPSLLKQADIVVAAIGRPNAIQGEWLKEGSCAIDVGINRLESRKLVGDVDFESAKERCGWITPVPGGVGPMTIASLLQNTVDVAQARGR